MRRWSCAGARCLEGGGGSRAPRRAGRSTASCVGRGRSGRDAAEIDLDGRWLLPALVNAHDVLDLSTLPPLGRPPHDSVYEWTRGLRGADCAAARRRSAVPLADRLFLGGMRNLLAGAASVLHHHPDHRSLARDDFPVRVQRRYAFAHSPGLTPALRRRTARATGASRGSCVPPRGSDPGLRGEIDALAAANVLRQNTVIAHGTALEPEDAPRLAAARACARRGAPRADRASTAAPLPAARCARAGVRVGLGSDGAARGRARPLSNARRPPAREGAFDDATLVELATRGSAEVARMPVGRHRPAGDPADLVAAGSRRSAARG